MMRILVGGSASTGSSLLKTILGRHEDIFAGSETSLFTKRELYKDYSHYKSRILKRFPLGLKSHSYHMFNGVDLEHPEYNWTLEELKNMIKTAPTFQAMADSFFHRGMDKYGKLHWLEKTPGNAYLFTEFLNLFPGSKVIHITRNPIDTIYSLIKRGYNLVESCGIYLLNTSAALMARDHADYYEIKYEAIVSDSQSSIQQLMDFLGLTFHEDLLIKGNPYEIKDTSISTWEHDETDSIKPKIKIIPESIKKNILQGMSIIKVSQAGRIFFNLSIDNFTDLLELTGYTFNPQPVSKENIKLIRSQMKRDQWSRVGKFYQTGIHYPLSIQAEK